VLSTLSATRICARWSPDDPDVWARPVPVLVRPARAELVTDFRWRALLRNPQALALTGMVAAAVTVEGAVARLRRT
jgi:hypothetical protein